MKTLPDFLQGEPAWRARFEHRLAELLPGCDVNLFILICANASLCPELLAGLSAPLQAEFVELRTRLARDVDAARSLAPDDRAVFAGLATAWPRALDATSLRRVAPWEIQFNPLRALRPARNAAASVDLIRRPFDDAGFHFNKPFLQQELIWRGHAFDHGLDIYYNKFPFADLHALLVPDRERCLPQYLDAARHRLAWRFVEAAGVRMPSVRLGYNSLGAFASVNHLHFQMCARGEPLPVEAPRWTHNGGTESYPLDCVRFTESGAAWRAVEALHRENVAYNLVYAPGVLYCLPRKKQGDVGHPVWTSGFSWYEAAGAFITSRRDDFERLDAPALAGALAAWACAAPAPARNP